MEGEGVMYAFKLHKNYLMGNGELGNGEMGNGEVACHRFFVPYYLHLNEFSLLLAGWIDSKKK